MHRKQTDNLSSSSPWNCSMSLRSTDPTLNYPGTLAIQVFLITISAEKTIVYPYATEGQKWDC